MNNLTFQVKKLSEHAIIPTRADTGAAAFDLYAAEDVVILFQTRRLIKTNIAIHCSQGYYGQIEGRSGLAYKHGICVLGGVIDESYSGDIGVILLNTDHSKEFEVKRGDRIAQIIFHRYFAPELIEVAELEETKRGDKGFGSTGT